MTLRRIPEAATARPLAQVVMNRQLERRSGGGALETEMTAAALIMAAAISLPSIHLPKLSPIRAPKVSAPHLNIRMHDWALPDQHGEPRAVVEFEHYGKLMLAPVRINDKGPFLFAIDTAASRSVVDTSVVRKLKLRTRTVPAPGGAGAVTALWGSNLHVEDASIFAPQAYVAELPDPQRRKDPRVQGLLGSELFMAYVVRFDPDRREMRIYDPFEFKPTTGATPIPLVRRDGKLYARITLATANGQPVEREALIDTGSDTLVSDSIVETSSAAAPVVIRNSAGGAVSAYTGQLRTVQVGPYALYNVWGASDGEPSIGMELLRRFVVTFDVAHSRMYLEPTHRTWEGATPPPT